MKMCLELDNHIKKFREDENYFQFFRELALKYLNIDPDYVRCVMEELIKVCEEKEYYSAHSWCILYIGWSENIKGNVSNAITLHKRALEFFENSNNDCGCAAVYNAFMVDYIQIGYLELSIEYGVRGIEFYEKFNDNDAIVALMINTASVYVEYKNYGEAVSILDRIKLYRYDHRLDYEVEMNVIKAECYLGTKKYIKAEKCCIKVLECIKENKFIQWEDKALLILAQIYSNTRRYEEAEEYFLSALKVSEKYKNFYMQGKVLLIWGIHHMKNNNYDKCENIFLDAINRIGCREYILIKERIYYYLSKLYEKSLDYENAYKCLKNSVKCKNILKNDSQVSLKRLKEKDMIYAVQKYKSLYDKMERISNLGKTLTANLDVEKFTYIIYEEIKKLVMLDTFAIGIYEKNKKELNYKIVFKNDKKLPGIVSKVEEGKSLGAYCICNKNDIIINNMAKEYSKYIYKVKINKKQLQEEAKSIISIPLLLDNEATGVMTVQSHKINAYTNEDLNELKILASYVAIAMRNLQLFNEAKHFAEYDVLTECFNRNKILSLGKKIYDESKENGYDLCVAMVDVDNFKSINDNYGHGAGDHILKSVARIMKKNIGDNDYIGRYGGEEFIIIFNKKNIEQASDICENLRRRIEKSKYNIGDRSINATVSIGIFEIHDNISFSDGIKYADESLYVAKKTGKNKIVKTS